MDDRLEISNNHCQALDPFLVASFIKRFVRLAVFNERKRLLLKRDDLLALLDGQVRAFAHVFNEAKIVLRDAFGFEIAAQQVGNSSPKNYILRSALIQEDRKKVAEFSSIDPLYCLGAVVLSLIYVHRQSIPEGLTSLNH